MSESHKSVVRNEGYVRGNAENIERHNERKNTNYKNIDVVLEQSHNNVHFKVCDGTYLGVFDKMIEAGEISTKGLKLNNIGKKPESSIIGEMVFDVNTEYFDSQYEAHGYASGYEFAKAFYSEAYKMAVAEVGNEKYILSAVMHADERNGELSRELGRDVYHYHLHVVYIPVVRTEVKWTKKCKDPALVGTVKEVINQVCHSKKWECEKVVGEDGKESLVYSYSKLQDRYHDHMKAAGFSGFERGKVGSTAEHLSVLDYKTKARQEELAEKEKALADSEKELEQKSAKLTAVDGELAALGKQLSQKENRVGKLTEKEKGIQERIKSIEDSGEMLTLKQLEQMQTRVYAPLVGKSGIILSEDDEKSLRKMAMATAMANEEARRYRVLAKTGFETIRDIIQAVGLLKFNFKGNAQPSENLTPEQEILITAIRKHGMDISQTHGYNKLVDDMKKATMSKPLSDIFHLLEKEYRERNRPSIIDTVAKNARELNEQSKSAPSINRERKDRGAAL